MKKLTFLLAFTIILFYGCKKQETVNTNQTASSVKAIELNPESLAKFKDLRNNLDTRIGDLKTKLATNTNVSPENREAQISDVSRVKMAEWVATFKANLPLDEEDEPITSSRSLQIYVPDNYLTIQEAVDAASPGDKIIVRRGVYYEDVEVTTDSITLKSEKNAGPIIIGQVTFDGVTGGLMEGFTLYGSEVDGLFSAIVLFECTEVTLKNNGMAFAQGIVLIESDNCSVKSNYLVDNYPIEYINLGAISVVAGSGNEVSGNFSGGNAGSGILLLETFGNKVMDNTCNLNGGYFDGNYPEFYQGILVLGGGDNDFMKNEAYVNLFGGLFMLESDDNKIGPQNTFNRNAVLGLYLVDSDNNKVQVNTALDNGDCDAVDAGAGNQFISNNFGCFSN